MNYSTMELARGRRRRRSPASRTLWSLAVLAMLREHDMHPYEMQRVMHQRHTDELLALKRGSLYHAINQLQRDGLIEPIETSREGRRPERTVYQITREGVDELRLWLRDLLAVPVYESSQFTAALAFIRNLPADDALEQLEQRARELTGSVVMTEAIANAVSSLVGRASVLELEYQRALAEAELAWLRTIIDDLRSGRLQWNSDAMNLDIAYFNVDMNNIHNDRD